jgi:fructokinase
MMPSSTQHNVVCFGEILWDILPDKSLPGGAPMNVAYHLKKLGNNPAMITKIGIDDLGKELIKVLSEKGINTGQFQMDYDHPTGVVYAQPNEHNEVTYDIVQPVAWDFIQWEDEFATLLKESEFFVFGSLTSRSEVSRKTLYQLLEIAKYRVLDINLRPPHFSRAHVEYLLRKADVLKMNLAELELITGWFNEFKTTEERMLLLQDQFNIDTIIVTMGGEGAMLIDKGLVCRHPGYKVQVTDTIGSGDAFLAGFLHKRLHGATAQQALSFACSTGALVATYSGACPDYDTEEITALMNSYYQQKMQINY